MVGVLAYVNFRSSTNRHPVVLRVIWATFNQAQYIIVFVYTVELVGKDYRAYSGFGMHVAWLVGAVLLGPIGYFFRDWRVLTKVCGACYLPCVLLLFCPESPSYLMQSNRPISVWVKMLMNFE